MFSCKSLIHKLKTGDHFSKKKIEITPARIEKLKPGHTTGEEFRKIFDDKIYLQMTYVGGYQKEFRGKQYQLDRILGIFWAPSKVWDEEKGFTSYGWTERIYLTGFFSNDVLQFFTVSHEVKKEDKSIVTGPLMNFKEDEGGRTTGYWPAAGCDVAFYEHFMQGDKQDEWLLKECGFKL